MVMGTCEKPATLGSPGSLWVFFPKYRLGHVAQAGPDAGLAGSAPLGCGSCFCVKALLEQNPIKPP